jgi:DNA-binding MarR family transcriptional regulator
MPSPCGIAIRTLRSCPFETNVRNPMTMLASAHTASPLFLREDEVRRGIELLHFGQSHLVATLDDALERHQLGRAHHRALYFIARQPDLAITTLLRLLDITKQSLSRILDELIARELVETRPGSRDRRQKLLRLTAQGIAIENELFETIRERMANAYAQAGQGSVTGFWRVLEGLIEPEERGLIASLQIPR